MILEEETAQGSVQWSKKSPKSGGGAERTLWGAKVWETHTAAIFPTKHLEPQLPMSTDAFTVTVTRT